MKVNLLATVATLLFSLFLSGQTYAEINSQKTAGGFTDKTANPTVIAPSNRQSTPLNRKTSTGIIGPNNRHPAPKNPTFIKSSINNSGNGLSARCTKTNGKATCTCKPPRTSMDCKNLIGSCKKNERVEDPRKFNSTVLVPKLKCTASKCSCAWVGKGNSSTKFRKAILNQNQALAPVKKEIRKNNTATKRVIKPSIIAPNNVIAPSNRQATPLKRKTSSGIVAPNNRLPTKKISPIRTASKTYECHNAPGGTRCVCTQGTGTCGKMMKICKGKMSCTGNMCRCIADDNKLLETPPANGSNKFNRYKTRMQQKPSNFAPNR
jgi:hypothetical protein